MGKHEVPAGPEGRAARLWRHARTRRQRRPAVAWRTMVDGCPVFVAGGFMEQTDTPWLPRAKAEPHWYYNHD